MRIGMAQMDISWENIEDNKKKVEEFFQKAVLLSLCPFSLFNGLLCL